MPPTLVALIVEEDSELRQQASTLLEESALDVITCESAEAALSVMQRRHEIALIFADVRLAGLIDGVDLARMVAHHWPDTKVIVTGDPVDRIDGLPTEAAYMPKPWRALDVLIAVEQALPRRAA